MKQLNVAISDEAMEAAKQAAEERGMMLRRWVERVILDAATAKVGKPERTYVPLENE